jgi:hypothetical protein
MRDKRQEVVALPRGLAFADICETAWESRRGFVFEVKKKLLEDIKE